MNKIQYGTIFYSHRLLQKIQCFTLINYKRSSIVIIFMKKVYKQVNGSFVNTNK